MTNWLKWRLSALIGTALLVGGATFLHAQNENHGPPAKTPEEAAINFYRLLDIVRTPPQSSGGMDEQKLATLTGSIQREQFEALSSSRGEAMIVLLAQQSVAQPFDATVQSSSGSQTIVSVAPSTKPLSREVVVIQDGGGYRVDVVATYGRWNKLQGIEADKAFFRESGYATPALAALPGFLGANSLNSCQSNQKQIMLGILQYTQDYDEKYPPARKWIDVVMPYVKSEDIFKCPAVTKAGNGYAYNSKFSQISLSAISEPARTINIYETSNLSRNVFAPFNGRAYRHQQGGESGMNIGFADGHVKWFPRGKSEQLSIEPEAGTGFITISTGAKQ